jgi:Mlc titration factor MtfA (ptsG expression regulator)
MQGCVTWGAGASGKRVNAMFGFKRWRRRRLQAQAFPASWAEILEHHVPYYRLLPDADQKELQAHIRVFLAEKNFEGCGGLEMTDAIKVTIAAQACILLLHRKTDYYPGLYSILVYPNAFVVKAYQELAPGFWVEGHQIHLGESWQRGALVLAWDHVWANATDVHDGHNVVLHEFAHQLDTEDGKADGAPILQHRSLYVAWARILGRDYQRLREDAAQDRPSLLDPYGATDPAEFFAVATECFFEKPSEMRLRHPELYRELQLYYQQDPAELGQRHERSAAGEAQGRRETPLAQAKQA